MNWALYADGIAIIITLALLTWGLSLWLKDVSIVDSAWSLMFLTPGVYYFYIDTETDLAKSIFFILLVLWALRLSIYLTWRNWGEPEDKRYQEIRKKYSPDFEFKSLFLIFVFQAILASIISIPVVVVMGSEDVTNSIGYLEYVAIFTWCVGFLYESIADVQLARFKAGKNSSGKVMDTGLWKNCRHPNYFGEFLVWWGFYIYAFSSGPWWIIISPLLMSWLLLKFSGVVMLEETIVHRRPKYKKYIKTTNAFFPGPVKR